MPGKGEDPDGTIAPSLIDVLLPNEWAIPYNTDLPQYEILRYSFQLQFKIPGTPDGDGYISSRHHWAMPVEQFVTEVLPQFGGRQVPVWRSICEGFCKEALYELGQQAGEMGLERDSIKCFRYDGHWWTSVKDLAIGLGSGLPHPAAALDHPSLEPITSRIAYVHFFGIGPFLDM